MTRRREKAPVKLFDRDGEGTDARARRRRRRRRSMANYRGNYKSRFVLKRGGQSIMRKDEWDARGAEGSAGSSCRSGITSLLARSTLDIK